MVQVLWDLFSFHLYSLYIGWYLSYLTGILNTESFSWKIFANTHTERKDGGGGEKEREL